MTTPQPFSLHAVPSACPSATGERWADLDAELARWLRHRTSAADPAVLAPICIAMMSSDSWAA